MDSWAPNDEWASWIWIIVRWFAGSLVRKGALYTSLVTATSLGIAILEFKLLLLLRGVFTLKDPFAGLDQTGVPSCAQTIS